MKRCLHFSLVVSAHRMTWSLSSSSALQMGHTGDALGSYREVMDAVGRISLHILISWIRQLDSRERAFP